MSNKHSDDRCRSAVGSIENEGKIMEKEIPAFQMEQILDSISQGKKIEAIKFYRDATGASLMQAKVFIENLESEINRTQSPNGTDTSGAKQGCVGVVLLGITVTIAAANLLF